MTILLSVALIESFGVAIFRNGKFGYFCKAQALVIIAIVLCYRLGSLGVKIGDRYCVLGLQLHRSRPLPNLGHDNRL